MNISRRSVALLPAALTACGFVDKSPFFSTLATFNKNASPSINRRRIDATPFASLVAWFDGNVQSLMVLGEYQGDGRLVWYSAQSQAMTTWGGFVLGLVGTEVGLYSTTLVGQWDPNPLKMVGQRLGRVQSYQAPNNRVSIDTKSRFTDGGVETIKVFDRDMRLRKVNEAAVADRYHHYRNEYWVEEATGLTWRTKQTVIPSFPPLNIAITKMPRRNQSAA